MSGSQGVPDLKVDAALSINVGVYDHDDEFFARANAAEKPDIKTFETSLQTIEDIEATFKKRSLRKAAANAARATSSLLQRNFEGAAEYFKQAATEVPASHPSIRREYFFAHAEALFGHGEQSNSCPALVAATEIFQTLLIDFPRGQDPIEWANTQFALGKTLASLGKRESDPARLQAAVAAYRAALTERPRDRAPLDWAETQYNLGCTLHTLGTLFGATYFQEAIAAYSSALEERNRPGYPADKAEAIQSGLGNAISALAERSFERPQPKKLSI